MHDHRNVKLHTVVYEVCTWASAAQNATEQSTQIPSLNEENSRALLVLHNQCRKHETQS